MYFLLFLFPLLLLARPDNPEPYLALKISSFEFSEQKKQGILGVHITLKCKTDSSYIPENYIHKRLNISIVFMDNTKKILPPADAYTRYSLNKQYAGQKIKTGYYQDIIIQGFIPYYAFDLPAGKQKIHLKITKIYLQAEYRDKNNQTTKVSIPVLLSGQKEKSYEFINPEKRQFRICIGNVELLPYDANGEDWDHAFFSRDKEKPDISIGIKTLEYRYFFPEIKNMFYTNYSGACSDWITVSQGDVISVEVLDMDKMSPPDVAGVKRFSEESVQETEFPLLLQDFGQIKIWEIRKAEFRKPVKH